MEAATRAKLSTTRGRETRKVAVRSILGNKTSAAGFGTVEQSPGFSRAVALGW